jgi:hypothetical protein
MADNSGGGRRYVTSGRYSKVGNARNTGNRWEALDSGSGNGTEVRQERTSDKDGGGSSQDRTGRSMSVEIDEVGQEGARGNGSGGVETGKKRNLDERSPGVHDGQRVNRKRLNEFEMGEVFEEIVKRMNRDLSNLMEKAPEGFKSELKEGLEIMMEGMKDIMNGVSDGVAGERKAREAEEMRTEDKLEKIVDEIKEIKNISDGMVNDRMEQKIRASEKEMEEKLRVASCSLKILDFDFGESTDDRGWMVRTVLNYLKSDVHPEDKNVFDRIIRKTRIVILGRKTSASSYRGKTVHTVPILLECQNKTEAVDLDSILRQAGYFSTFHWPQEMVEFVNGVREEVRKMGFSDQTHYVRVRPEERGGNVQIRADIKEKKGGRFVPKAVWICPPANKQLWERINGLYVPRMLGGGRRTR